MQNNANIQNNDGNHHDNQANNLMNLPMPVVGDNPRMQSRKWVFTIPNYQEADYSGINWGVFGGLQGEISPTTGTRHLQGFVCFASGMRLSTLKNKYHASAHWERMKGTIDDSIAYCSKSDSACPLHPYRSWGDRALTTDLARQGHRTDLQEACEALQGSGSVVARLKRVADSHPDVFVRYSSGFEKLARLTQNTTCNARLDQLYPWQQNLDDILKQPANDRSIVWIWDSIGNKGKSAYIRHCLSSDYDCIVLSGKISDMSFMYENQKIVFFDVPRTQVENLDHLMAFAEKLKDGVIVSTKYDSRMKTFQPPHVVFFANVCCPFEKWSRDRLIEICLD